MRPALWVKLVMNCVFNAISALGRARYGRMIQESEVLLQPGHKWNNYVFFNHSIHIKRGINCNNCHGPVQSMQMAYKGRPFQMRWCLECHRNGVVLRRCTSELVRRLSHANTVAAALFQLLARSCERVAPLCTRRG